MSRVQLFYVTIELELEPKLERLTTVCRLFAQCSHQEQLILMDELPKYLCRDFISLLPLEIVSMIMSYLEPRDVLNNCMLVSSAWYRILSDCKSYWREQYETLHKTTDHIEQESFKNITIATLRFESSLSKLTSSKVKEVSGVLETGMHRYEKHMVPVGVSIGWFYILTYDGLFLGHNLTELDKTFKVGRISALRGKRFCWSWSAGSGALFYVDNGSWVFVSYPDLSSPFYVPRLPYTVWQGDIRSPADFERGGCPDCRLVIECAKRISNAALWTVDVVQLLDGSDTAQSQTIQFSFLPDPQFGTSLFFTIRCARLYPATESCSALSHGVFCKEHFLIIQIGLGVVVYKLQHREQTGFELSEPVHILCPLSLSWTDIGRVDPSNFLASKDQSLLALLPNEHTLTVWNLKNNVEYSHMISPPAGVTKLFLISVDKLYCVIGFALPGVKTQFSVHVMSTTTGRVILETVAALPGSWLRMHSALPTVTLEDLWLKNVEPPLKICNVLSTDPLRDVNLPYTVFFSVKEFGTSQ